MMQKLFLVLFLFALPSGSFATELKDVLVNLQNAEDKISLSGAEGALTFRATAFLKSNWL